MRDSPNHSDPRLVKRLNEDALLVSKEQSSRLLDQFDKSPGLAPLRRKIALAFVGAVLLTCFLGLSSWRNVGRSEEDARWVSHTQEVMKTLQTTVRHLMEVEAGARGFALSGYKPVLQPYDSGRSAIGSDLNALRQLTGDNPRQQERLNILGPQVTAKVESNDALVAARRQTGTIPSAQQLDQEMRLLDAARATLQQMEDEEETLLALRSQKTRDSWLWTISNLGVGSFLGISFLVMAGLAIYHQLAANERSNALNLELNRQLRQNATTLQAEMAEGQLVNEARERLACIVESSDDAIVSKDMNGTITAWNRGAEKLFGYPATQAVGQSIMMLMPPGRIHEESDILSRIQRGESVERLETVRVRKDGTSIDVSVTISPIRDNSGTIIGASKIVRDITERKRAEEALRDSEERFQAMANGIPQLAWMAEADGRISWYNQRWYDYTGTTFEQMEGWAWQTVYDPEMLPKVMERWRGSIASGEPMDMEFPLRGADGKFRMFLTRIMPLKDAGGRMLRWFGTNTDISAREEAKQQLAWQTEELSRQAEDLMVSRTALEGQKRMLRSVLDSMAEGLVATDEQGKFIIWNPAAEKIVGLGPSELDPAEWSSHYGAYLPDRVTPFPIEQNPLFRAIRGATCTAEMFVHNPKLPEGVWIELSGTPLKDKDGVARGGVVAFRDITQRKTDQAEIRKLNDELEERVTIRTAELAAANNELEAFTYSVSHDLRAPLRHMSGFTRILMEDFGPSLPEQAQEHLRRIESGALRMGQLVDELLNLARLGRHALSVQVTALAPIIKDVLTMLEPECDGRLIEWKIADMPSVECDPTLIRQVFQNLVGNALKYSRPRSPAVVEIGQIQQNGCPVLFVRDNGVGFSMKYADKLFGVFQRLHKAEDFEGTGVGLATVQRIIQKHGGRIWGEAELDRGATFYFTLGKEQSVSENAATAAGA